MNSRDLADFRRAVLGDEDVSKRTGITANALQGLGGANIAKGLEQLLSDPILSSSKLQSPLSSTSTLPVLSETVNGLTGTSSPNGQWHNNLLSNAFGLAPLVRGLLGLFHRNDASKAPQLTRFSLPAPLRTEAAMSSGKLSVNIDRGMGDRIRPLGLPDSSASIEKLGGTAIPAMSTAVNNITVQVNAIDSRSFLDHSEDIARAVRDAMLHSHALNDVVNDL